MGLLQREKKEKYLIKHEVMKLPGCLSLHFSFFLKSTVPHIPPFENSTYMYPDCPRLIGTLIQEYKQLKSLLVYDWSRKCCFTSFIDYMLEIQSKNFNCYTNIKFIFQIENADYMKSTVRQKQTWFNQTRCYYYCI